MADIAAVASDRAAQRDASILQNLCEHRRILAGHQNAAPGVGAVCGCGGYRLAAFRRQHKHSQPPLRRKRHHETLKAQAEDKGYHWIDWNVCAEDATASHPDAAQILRNIRRDADGQDTCVVLLHDTKATGQTVKALPDMIAYFREQATILYGCTDGCLAM